ncbi:MAG: FlgD immunoglobulin-like domain containing protein [candidate division WOR-3 bacterium]
MFFIFLNIFIMQSPEIKWGRIYGGDNDDYARAVIECSDKGFIAVGSTNSFGNGGYDVYVFKVDSLGYPIWTKTFGGSQDDYGYAICPTDNNNYLILGTTYSFTQGMGDIFLIKINEYGDSIWTETYGDSLEESGYSIVKTYDNKYLICGTTNSSGAGNNDVFLIKIDSTGNIIWFKTYGGNLDDYAYCVNSTFDDGCIITGETYSYGNGGSDVYTVKIDSLGDIEWTGLYGSYLDEKGFCVQQTQDSGYIVCGTGYFTLLGYEWCLLRYNQRGTLIWSRFQGSLNNDTAFSVQEVGQNNYVIGGNFSYEMYVVRTDTSGLNLWMFLYGGTGTDCAYSVKKTSDNGYIIAGITNSYGAGDNNAYLVKTYTDPVGVKELCKKAISPIKIRTFPSPFREKLYIKFAPSEHLDLSDIKIYDINGRLLKKLAPKKSGIVDFIWDGNDENANEVPPGIYFICADNLKEKIIISVIKL